MKPEVPNAYSYDYNQYLVHEATEAAQQLIEQTRHVPINPTYGPAVSLRTVMLQRRWVYVPGKGTGAVWADENNRTRGPICFAGQRTLEAPETIKEPEGVW